MMKKPIRLPHRILVVIRRILAFVQTNMFAISSVVFLWVLLWQGDGQQMQVDGIALGMLTLVTVYVTFKAKPLRTIPRSQIVLATLFFVYVLFLMPYSDDIGNTVFSLFRYCILFLAYALLYVYSTKRTLQQLFSGLVVFGVLAIGASIYVASSYDLSKTIPHNTLLHSIQGHHPLIALLLLVYPLVFVWWMEMKKPIALLGTVAVFLASVMTFSRAGVGIEVVFSLGYVLYSIIKKRTLKRLHIVILGLIVALSVLLFVFPYSPTNTLLSALTRQGKTSEITVARTEYMRQAIVSFFERPVFGSGLGTFHLQSLRLEKKVFTFAWLPHSIPLQHLSDVGIVGAVILWGFIASVLFPLFFRVPREKIEKRIYISYLLSLGVLFLFSLVDIPFMNILISLLFWAIVGALGGSYDRSSPLSHRNILLPVFSMILCVLAVIGYSDLWFFWKENGVPVCNPIRMERIFICLKQANRQNDVFPSRFRQRIEQLHRKQRYILLQLSEMEEHAGERERAWTLCNTAITYDPFSAYTYYPCFRFLVRTEQYKKLGEALEQWSSGILSPERADMIQNLGLEQEWYYPAYEQVIDDGMPQGYVALYYRLGLAMMQRDPSVTEQLWRLSRDVNPDNGHLHVEYADLLRVTLDMPDVADQALLDCQNYPLAAVECAEWKEVGVPQPGRLESVIRAGK